MPLQAKQRIFQIYFPFEPAHCACSWDCIVVYKEHNCGCQRAAFQILTANCAGGVRVHDRRADDSEQGNRYEELLPRGGAVSLVCCQRLHWMDHKVCPHSRTYGDNVKQLAENYNTLWQRHSAIYAHKAIRHSSNLTYAFCICHPMFRVGRRVSRCVVQMPRTYELVQYKHKKHSFLFVTEKR